MELHVLLQDSALPSRDKWQAGINESGFKLVLDETLDLREQTGYSPSLYNGVQTGFEFDLSPAEDITSSYEALANQAGPGSISANFRWGGNMRELFAASIASAVLAKITSGIVYDPENDLCSTGDEALASARQLIETVKDLD